MQFLGQFSWLESVALSGYWLLAQGDAAAPAAPAGKGGGGGGGIFETMLANPLIPFMLIGVVFYLLLMRPEQKKRKQQAELLSALKKNDHVVTIGGIAGTIVNAPAGSTFVTIRVDDSTNTRLRVLRSAISRVGEPDAGEEEATESK